MATVHLGPPEKKTSVGGRFPPVGTAVAFAANALVRTGSGILHKIVATNKNAAAVYMWVFDGTSSSGNLMFPPVQIAANGTATVDERYGIPFNTGCFIAFSSTLATFTVVATTDFAVSAGYSVQNDS